MREWLLCIFIMDQNLKKISLIFFVFLISSFSLHGDTLRLNDDFQSMEMDTVFEILKDTTNQLQIENFLLNAEKYHFKSLDGKTNLGFSNNTYWLKFSLNIDSGKKLSQYILKFKLANIHNISCYVTKNNSILKKTETGLLKDIDTRDYPNAKFTFTILLKPREVYTIFIKLNSQASLMVDASLYTITNYTILSDKINLVNGTFIGIIIISLIYFLFMFYKLKDMSLLYLALTSLLFLVFYISFEGILTYYFVPNLNIYTKFITAISNLLLIISFTLFAITFLELKSFYPKIYRCYQGLNIILLLFSLTYFILSYYIFIRTVLIFMLLVFLTLIPTTFNVLKKGYGPARFFLISILVLVLTIVYRILILLEIIKLDASTADFYKYAILGLILFFAQALAERIHLIQSGQKRSEKKFRLFVDNTHDGILILNWDLHIEYINPTASKLFDNSPKELIGKNIVELIENPENKHIIDHFTKGKWEQKIFERKEFQITKKSGEKRNVEISTTFTNDSNIKEMVFVYIQDITDRIQMQEMLMQSEKMLSIGGLASGMAHEINNPLAGMLQNAAVMQNRLIKKSPKNLELAEKLGIDYDRMLDFLEQRNIIKMTCLIKETGERATEIVRNMLSFAKKNESSFKEVDIRKTLDNTIELINNDYDMKKHYDFRKIQITKNYQHNLPNIRVQESKLKQVFMNILKNSAEAMTEKENNEKKPTINIKIFEISNSIKISIENNGPSIPDHVKNRIFEPFFTTKGRDKGTGLGLSISYFIITKDHGGEMYVESDESFGTRFIIKIPLHQN